MTWVKAPAALARDRMLAIYSVRPQLANLRRALLVLAGVHAING
jgi:hypothetical protein